MNASIGPVGTAARPWPQYGLAVALAIAAAVVRLTVLQALGLRAAYITFYPAVMIAALYGGLPAGLIATVLSILEVDYFFIEPTGSLHTSAIQPTCLAW